MGGEGRGFAWIRNDRISGVANTVVPSLRNHADNLSYPEPVDCIRSRAFSACLFEIASSFVEGIMQRMDDSWKAGPFEIAARYWLSCSVVSPVASIGLLYSCFYQSAC